jgi:hypothetical protein
MESLNSKYRIHYEPLFDNSTDAQGNLRDRRTEVDEGAVQFLRNGTVVLGEMGGYVFTRPIHDVTFAGGYIARRNMEDRTLVINSPTGEVFKFTYSHEYQNWYRLLRVENDDASLTELQYAMREITDGYGPVIGPVVVSSRLFFAGLRGLIRTILIHGVTLYVGYWAARLINAFYWHLGPESVARMTYLVWLIGAGVLWLGILASTAQEERDHFNRVTMPLLSLAFFVALGCWLFYGTFFDTLEAFLKPHFSDDRL